MTLVLSKAFEKIVAGKLSKFLKSNSLLPSSQFSYSYFRGMGTCDALHTLSHHLQVALEEGMEGRLVQLGFSVVYNRVSDRGLSYKLKSISVRGQFLFIVTLFLSDRSGARAFRC